MGILKNKRNMFMSVGMMGLLLVNSPIVAEAKYFSDVTSYNREYKDCISFVADNGYMNGTATNLFSPATTMSRAMFVTTLYNVEGQPAVSGSIPFVDVPSNSWYYNAVRWAYSIGLISGTGPSNFNPGNDIARQDAIRILYLYANYKGLPISEQANISGYTDYNNVASYALSAVKWAVARDIYPYGSSTTLIPTSSFTRADMAKILTRFGTNVEFIAGGRDNYSFANSSSNFSSYYYITSQHYNRLINHVNAYYGEDTTDALNTIALIDDMLNDPWGGSCYGMASTCILDKVGKIDMNTNFATNASTINAIQMQSASITESAINYYQVSQAIDFTRDNPRYYDSYTFSEKLVHVVEDMTNHKGVALFLYGMNGGGHAIVVYNLENLGNSSYRLTAYDNRYPNNAVYVLINTANNTCYIQKPNNTYETVTYLELFTNLYGMDHIDLDWDYNVGSGINQATYGDHVTLYVDMNGDFSVTNAEGKQLEWSNYSLSGDMEVLKSYKIINGPDRPSTYVLMVRSSDQLTVSSLTEGKELNVRVASENGFQSLKGVKTGNIYIDVSRGTIND